jgi:sulfur-oxidizing protein SoxX
LLNLRSAHAAIAVFLAVGIGALAVALAPRGLATIVPAPQTPDAPGAACHTDTGEVADYRLVPGTTLSKAIDKPLAGRRGEPERGVRWVVSPQRGHCIACHEIPSLKDRIKPDEPGSRRRFGHHGTVGPSLDGVAARYTEGELRLLVVDPSAALPAAVKPAYHRVEGLHGVDAACAGKPILSAAQVEDIVAFLGTLK